jgi:capsular polysaccharide transport system permease protein
MRLLKNNRILWYYLLFVGIPLSIVTGYIYLIAADRFVTLSTIVVKQVGEVSSQPTGGLGALLGVSNTSVEDAQFLKAYVQSPDLVFLLDKKLNLRKEFYADGGDPVFQLSQDASREELVEYFNKFVQIAVDEKTSMLTITTQGFTPLFSKKLNEAILSESEYFINQVSQRVAKDQLVFAKEQLSEAALNLSRTRENLIAYQNKNQMFDPQTNALAVSQLVMQLQTQLADLQTQERALLSYLNVSAPQVIALRSQIDAVQDQIDQEKAQLTSPQGGEKLNRQSAEFEELKSKVDFAVDLYKISLASLEKARLEAVRKLKNVVIITTPQLAQDAYYPRRGYMLFSTFLVLSLVFGIIQLVRSVVREHQE